MSAGVPAVHRHANPSSRSRTPSHGLDQPYSHVNSEAEEDEGEASKGGDDAGDLRPLGRGALRRVANPSHGVEMPIAKPTAISNPKSFGTNRLGILKWGCVCCLYIRVDQHGSDSLSDDGRLTWPCWNNGGLQKSAGARH